MPEKQQPMSSFAASLGGQLSAANAEHKDKPVDLGERGLPPGIKNGIAKLSTVYTKLYDKDAKNLCEGKPFFRASAVVMSPEVHDGQKVGGRVTSVVIPLCTVPAKGRRKEKPFSTNYYDFQNFFKSMGIAPCPETPATDPNGSRTEAFFFAAMAALNARAHSKNPADNIYIGFETRGWTPEATATDPKPNEMVFEEWHGLAQWNGKADPVALVGATGAAAGPPIMPPTGASHAPPAASHATPPTQQPPAAATAPAAATVPQEDPADVVAALVEAAMADPEGKTEDGRLAGCQLEDMALARGWTKQQTTGAADWSVVGDMALSLPADAPPAALPDAPVAEPTVGSKWMFAKRTEAGEKLKNAKGEPFPPQEVEVTTIDAAARTCTVKTTRDGKPVVHIKTKAPIVVKFDWLERDLKI